MKRFEKDFAKPSSEEIPQEETENDVQIHTDITSPVNTLLPAHTEQAAEETAAALARFYERKKTQKPLDLGFLKKPVKIRKRK